MAELTREEKKKTIAEWESAIEKTEGSIKKLRDWLDKLSYSNGRCYVLCVAFNDWNSIPLMSTMAVENGKVERKIWTEIPYLTNKAEAEQMKRATFKLNGESVTPRWHLVRIDQWARETLESWRCSIETIKQGIENLKASIGE